MRTGRDWDAGKRNARKEVTEEGERKEKKENKGDLHHKQPGMGSNGREGATSALHGRHSPTPRVRARRAAANDVARHLSVCGRLAKHLHVVRIRERGRGQKHAVGVRVGSGDEVRMVSRERGAVREGLGTMRPVEGRERVRVGTGEVRMERVGAVGERLGSMRPVIGRERVRVGTGGEGLGRIHRHSRVGTMVRVSAWVSTVKGHGCILRGHEELGHRDARIVGLVHLLHGRPRVIVDRVAVRAQVVRVVRLRSRVVVVATVVGQWHLGHASSHRVLEFGVSPRGIWLRLLLATSRSTTLARVLSKLDRQRHDAVWETLAVHFLHSSLRLIARLEENKAHIELEPAILEQNTRVDDAPVLTKEVLQTLVIHVYWKPLHVDFDQGGQFESDGDLQPLVSDRQPIQSLDSSFCVLCAAVLDKAIAQSKAAPLINHNVAALHAATGAENPMKFPFTHVRRDEADDEIASRAHFLMPIASGVAFGRAQLMRRRIVRAFNFSSTLGRGLNLSCLSHVLVRSEALCRLENKKMEAWR
eukprot:m.185209 g.185209  ORF g.185209 m.185209 type:complete len:531 (+) comp15395_c0_seq61:122-1714(+)